MTMKEKIIVFKWFYLLLPVSVYFLFHSIRNLFQYLGKENILTRVGNHELGIKISNIILAPLGLRYDVSQEIYYFFLELSISILLLGLFVHYLTKE